LPDLLTAKQAEIGARILKEIRERLSFLNDVGLDYLTLSRGSGSLSGGESQRIRLASQIGSGLTGVLYVLDEPSIGLHQRDNERLLVTLRHLRDLGNTVIVVEHDEDAILSADHVVDVGPYAGVMAAAIVAEGTPQAIHGQLRFADRPVLSASCPYRCRSAAGDISKVRRLAVHPRSERQTNLKNVDAAYPARHLHLRDRRLRRRQVDPADRTRSTRPWRNG
jgi:excinuclease ABC subunit A